MLYIFVGWVIVARVMPKCDFFLKKEDQENFAYVLELMLTFDKMQYAQSLESEDRAFWKLFRLFIMYAWFYISGVLAQYSSVYIKSICCSQRPDHWARTPRIYRPIRTVWKAWITSKMLQPQISNFVHIRELLFLRFSRSKHKFQTISKIWPKYYPF